MENTEEKDLWLQLEMNFKWSLQLELFISPKEKGKGRDKATRRHGNKGIVRIVRDEDSILEDGTPVDIV